MNAYDEVLEFWFPEHVVADPLQLVRQMDWWFGGGSNAEVKRRFLPLLDRAAKGDLDDWAKSARSRLALIILLDQFSRSAFAGTPRAFAQDPKALALAIEGIDNGQYAELKSPWEKTFFFMPLGHSEVLANLDRVVRLAEQMVGESPPELRGILEHSASQARAHREVIARFGRHPHRNHVLERTSTAEELAYLGSGNLVHQRRPPSQ